MKKLTVTKRIVLTFGLALTMMAIPVTSGVVTANAAGDDVAIDEEHFPDEVFRDYVESFDENLDGSLSREERAAVKEIDVEGRNIENLEGIAYFPNLTELYCMSSELTKLDVSNCKKLEYLDCDSNKLTKLDASNCKKLEHLDCQSNELTKLDVSNCKKLEYLDCQSNELTKLDLGNCKNLTHLLCYRNKLTKLDVSNCKNLTYLYCSSNKLTKLDVSNCWDLSLSCDPNVKVIGYND